MKRWPALTTINFCFGGEAASWSSKPSATGTDLGGDGGGGGDGDCGGGGGGCV